MFKSDAASSSSFTTRPWFSTICHLVRRLTEQFGNPNFTPLVFDVTDELAVRRAAVIVREWLQGQRLSGLVNNAGLMFVAPAALTPIEDMRKLLDINLTGTLLCVQAFLPLLGTDKSLIGELQGLVALSAFLRNLQSLIISMPVKAANCSLSDDCPIAGWNCPCPSTCHNMQ